MSDSAFSLPELEAALAAARRPPAIKPWTNHDSGREFYFAYVHPARLAALSPRIRWKIAHHARRMRARYGFATLPESIIVELASQLDQTE